MTTSTQTASRGWRRVSRDRPCPVCKRPDWCLIAADGSAAICPRVESPRRIGEAGWFHRLRDDPWRPAGPRVRSVRLGDPRATRQDFARLLAGYQAAIDSSRLYQLARSLGLSPDSLLSLGVGWSAENRAWAFPMGDAGGQILGIRLRREDGRKFAVRGSREGLFLPSGDPQVDSPLLIGEGPTDTAALLDLGFAQAVGRPNCMGGITPLVEVVQLRQPAELVIVADGDEPGQRGAENLASVLVAYVPAVRVIQPPAGIKDARAWLRAGATRRDVQAAIDSAPARRLTIRAVVVQKG